MNKPLIKLYQTINGYYFYDVHCNKIVDVSKEEFDVLEKILNEKSISEEENRLLDKYRKKKYLSDERISIKKHEKTNDVESILDCSVSSVTLQMTQQCNLRCSYCIYSDDFFGQRRHSEKSMTQKVAYQAIDFLMLHSRCENTVDIGFYGGEPLLEYAKIIDIVAYIERTYPEKNVVYHMTTNGTLLNDKIVDFLVDKNFEVMVSIDGPKKIHDMHRRFAANGKGSFSVVRNNMKRIKERYPSFYKTMSLSMVEDPQNDYGEISSIARDEVFSGLFISSAVVDDSFSLKKAIYKNDYVAKRKYALFLAYIMNIKNTKNIDLFSDVLGEVHNNLLERSLFDGGRFEKMYSPGGACVAGQNKLFVDIRGNFYPCEKVSEKANVMQIGNVANGFDFYKVKELLNIGMLDKNSCRNCWAIRKCDLCAAHCERSGKLSAVMRNMHCYEVRAESDARHRVVILLHEAEKIYGYNVKRI